MESPEAKIKALADQASKGGAMEALRRIGEEALTYSENTRRVVSFMLKKVAKDMQLEIKEGK